MTVRDYGGPKKREVESTAIDPQPTEFRSWKKLALNAKSLILRNTPEPLCNGLVKVRMLKVLTISLLQHQQQEHQYQTSRIFFSRLCKRTREDPNRELQEQVATAEGKISIREEITCRQTDCLDHLRLLYKNSGDTEAILDFRDLSEGN